MLNEDLQRKIDLYEQLYFALDDPAPFKGELSYHPVLVRDYFKFYSCIPCLTQDKNVKVTKNPDGSTKKVANKEGLKRNYLNYIIYQIENEENGRQVLAQLTELFCLVFGIEQGFYCSKCGHEFAYQDRLSGFEEYAAKQNESILDQYKDKKKSDLAKKVGDVNFYAELEAIDNMTVNDLPADLIKLLNASAQNGFLDQATTCPDCGGRLRSTFDIVADEKGKKRMYIKDVEISSRDFDELKAIIPRQNILDYDGDMYMDADLKEELELKARLQNSDYTSPSLEKTLVCVAIGTGFTFEYLKGISMRKLSLLLRTIDKKETYYAQYQASMSGMVKFKEDPKHWIFSDDKKNITKEFTSLDDFTKKFDKVT